MMYVRRYSGMLGTVYLLVPLAKKRLTRRQDSWHAEVSWFRTVVEAKCSPSRSGSASGRHSCFKLPVFSLLYKQVLQRIVSARCLMLNEHAVSRWMMTYDILVVRYGMMMPNNWSLSFVCNKGHGITSYLHGHQHSWPGQSYESVSTPSTLSGTGSLGHLPCFHIFHDEMTMSAVRQAILANLGTSNAYFVDRYLGLWKTVIHDDGWVGSWCTLKDGSI